MFINGNMRARFINKFLNEGQGPPVMNVKQIYQILEKDLDDKNNNRKRKPIMFIIKPEVYTELDKTPLFGKIRNPVYSVKTDGEIKAGVNALEANEKTYERWLSTYETGGQPMLVLTNSLKDIPANVANQCDVAIIGGE